MTIGMVLALILASVPAPKSVLPIPTPPVFMTEQYGLTLRTPPGSTYCPLPKDWIGSDHGTEFYLEAPQSCVGAGYPSSGRGYRARRAPRQIDVFYAYWEKEDGWHPSACRAMGKVRLLGSRTPLCQSHWRKFEKVEVATPYRADTDAQVTFTLLTHAEHLTADLKLFRAMLQSVETCSAEWRGEDLKGKPTGEPFATGVGPRCPKDAKWF